jgi:hypothetical protein
LVAGEERPFVNFTGNSQLRTRATAEAYSSLAAMFEALQILEAETVNMLAALPDDFIAGKRSYWRLAFGLLQPNTHTREHLRQIEAAVAVARQQQPAPAE